MFELQFAKKFKFWIDIFIIVKLVKFPIFFNLSCLNLWNM